MNIKSEIGECVCVLFHKLWSKTPIKGQLKSKTWWENRLKIITNSPVIVIDEKDNLIPGIYDSNGNEIPPPVPYETELLQRWKQEEFNKYIGV
jgi:hypothetical protein